MHSARVVKTRPDIFLYGRSAFKSPGGEGYSGGSEEETQERFRKTAQAKARKTIEKQKIHGKYSQSPGPKSGPGLLFIQKTKKRAQMPSIYIDKQKGR